MEWYAIFPMVALWVCIASALSMLCAGEAVVQIESQQPNFGSQNDAAEVDAVPEGDLEDPLSPYETFDPYEILANMEDDDLAEIHEIQMLMKASKMAHRGIKYRYERKSWARHIDMLLQTNQFNQRYRMPKEDFDFLLDALEPAITVNFCQSRRSTDGNDPIFPELIMACGIRYLAHGDSVTTLADLYGVSESSAC